MNDLYSLSSISDKSEGPSFHSGKTKLKMRMHSSAAAKY